MRGKKQIIAVAVITSAALAFGLSTTAAPQEKSTSPTTTATYLQLADSADNYIRHERWEEAERILLETLRAYPAMKGNSMLLSNLGIVRTHLHDIPGAMEAYDVAEAMRPDWPAVYNNRAFTWLSTGNEDEALASLTKSLEIDSVQEWPLRMRGLLLLKDNRYAEARADLERYRRHHADTPDVLSALAHCAESEGNYEEAIGWYDASINEKQDEDAWFHRTLLKIRLNRLGEADDDLRRALAIYPSCGNLYLLRAKLRRQNYLNVEAEADEKTALQKGATREMLEAVMGQ